MLYAGLAYTNVSDNGDIIWITLDGTRGRKTPEKPNDGDETPTRGLDLLWDDSLRLIFQNYGNDYYKLKTCDQKFVTLVKGTTYVSQVFINQSVNPYNLFSIAFEILSIPIDENKS